MYIHVFTCIYTCVYMNEFNLFLFPGDLVKLMTSLNMKKLTGTFKNILKLESLLGPNSYKICICPFG